MPSAGRIAPKTVRFGIIHASPTIRRRPTRGLPYAPRDTAPCHLATTTGGARVAASVRVGNETSEFSDADLLELAAIEGSDPPSLAELMTAAAALRDSGPHAGTVSFSPKVPRKFHLPPPKYMRNPPC
jgi:hypothetical protein